MVKSLDVYLYGIPAANITRLRGNQLQLRYLPEYVLQPESVPISVQLPVTPEPISGDRLEWFLDNLLPEREGVRARWAREAGVVNRAFDLLSVYGEDVAGALEFYPSGESRRTDGELIRMSDAEIAGRIRHIRDEQSDEPIREPMMERLSLAGAQGKFALALHEGEWFTPSGVHPSTHILKPGIDRYPGSDVTEHITLRVAEKLGLPVANSSIELFEGEHVLVVERFDRKKIDGHYIRIHQEDLAQATGTPASQKYEEDGGPGYLEIFRVVDTHLSPAAAQVAKTRFVESLVFAWIIGHNDGHIKNYSITHLPGESILAPLYDLNCNLVFLGENFYRSRGYEKFDLVSMPFSVDGANTIGTYGKHTLRRLEQDAGLEPNYLDIVATNYASQIGPAVNEVIDSLPHEVRSIQAVRNFPFAAFDQRQRIMDLYSESL